MKVSSLMIATLLAALTGLVQAQTAAPAAPADPVVQARLEKKEVDKTFSDKKRALNKERNAKVKAAGDAAFAAPKGKEPAVARRDAEAKAKASTKADHDAKLKALKQEHDEAVAAIRKKYPTPPKS